MNPVSQSEALLEELRADLPGPEREERLRARLIAAGVLAGTVVSGATSAAAATGAAAKLGGGTVSSLWASWSALSLGAKAAVSVAIGASAGAGPIWLWQHSATSPVAAAAQTTVLRTTAAPSATAQRRRAPPLPSNPAEPRFEKPQAFAPGESNEPSARSDGARGPKAQERVATATPATLTPMAQRITGTRAVPGEGAAENLELTRAPPAASFEPPPMLVQAPRAPEPEHASAVQEPGPARTTLGEETVLIDRVFAALRAGAFAQAEALLTEHQRRFPAGHLVRERERARAKLTQAVQTKAYR